AGTTCCPFQRPPRRLQIRSSSGAPSGWPDARVLWSDSSLTLLPYGWGFAVDPEEQSTFTFEHAHGSKLGDLFIFVDFVKFHGTPNGADDSTWYGEISPRLSLGKVLARDLSYGPVKDVLIAGTYERGEDADVAEAALVGIGVDLDVGSLWGKPGKLFAGVELDFWWNKYQIPDSAAFDTNQSAVSLLLKYHL
ncbi:MAG: hypothetical protein OEX15_14560, partial [Gammaproteobacteria bacterium]|nr:hypothetical protein [Gammaproteobacteria bacterium]